MPAPLSQFVDILDHTFRDQTFLGLVLSNPQKSDPEQPRKQSVRPIQLRGELMYQWELQFQKQQTHLNLNRDDTRARFNELFGLQYRNAHLFSVDKDIAARITPKGVKLQQQPPSRKRLTSVPEHNRQKQYLIPEGVPCPFLIELDVTTPTGKVKQSRHKKFRQINRYLEIVNDIYDHLPTSGPIRVVDFGCGLSYLTFAVHHLLTVIHQRDVEFLGIDQNEHVITRCREIARKLNLPEMEFRPARIDEHSTQQPVDLAISLHACDTATDHSLAYAVSAGASVILAAPCCQRELMSSVNSAPLEPLLRHGVLKERISALATDALRSVALEAVGYRTQILEFIDLEHTPKNLMIRAIQRQPGRDRDAHCQKAQGEYQSLKQFFGVRELECDQILAAASQRDSQTGVAT